METYWYTLWLSYWPAIAVIGVGLLVWYTLHRVCKWLDNDKIF